MRHCPTLFVYMKPLYLLLSLLLSLGGIFLAQTAAAQQPVDAENIKTLIVSPVVGELIDGREKATYGLFPYYSAAVFQEARFTQALSPDSAIVLRTLLRDGRTVLRPFTSAEFVATRSSIESRAQEVRTAGVGAPATSIDSTGRRFRVVLRTGTAFDGELTARRPTQLEFLTTDLGIVLVERANIVRLEELNSTLARRPANWFDIGNGNRLFFQPTARNLRRGEGSLQSINLFLVGGNYGITDNFSVGLLASLVPGVPLADQIIAFTPKAAARLSEQWHVGAGALYLRVGGESAGIFYGNATYGSADDNLSLGLGYGFVSGEIGSTPVVQFGGQKRVSRRISLISENYFVADSEAGVGGLYGIKINWRRTSLGLAAAYVLPYDDADMAFTTYIIPAYIDFTFRFGKPAR